MSTSSGSPSFGALGVPAEMEAVLTQAGISEPFPIQTSTIPEALAGRDVIAKAPTGSGKTLAFGLPMIARITRARPKCPRALVLVPTRELCMQVAEVLQPIANANGLRVAQVFGGAGYGDQAKQIRHGCDIVVACPGRLGDLLERGQLMLKDVEVVVLDEADRMSDMGFMPDVKKLLAHIVVKHQVLLFSATLEGQVDKFVAQYMTDPFRFETSASKEDKSRAVHMFWQTKPHDRVNVTAQIAEKSSSTIIFCRTKHGVDRLTTQLKAEGVKAVAIHGGRTQAQRTRALKTFTDGAVRTLVATDVAARGLHIDNVDCVIHYDQPEDFTDYVHRSGRTARAGETGTVISVITRDQVRKVQTMQNRLKMKVAIQEPNMDDIEHLGGRPIIEPKRKANKNEYDSGDETDDNERRPAPKKFANRNSGRSKNGNRSTSSREGNPNWNRESRGTRGTTSKPASRDGRKPYRARGESNERSESTSRDGRKPYRARGESSGRGERSESSGARKPYRARTEGSDSTSRDGRKPYRARGEGSSRGERTESSGRDNARKPYRARGESSNSDARKPYRGRNQSSSRTSTESRGGQSSNSSDKRGQRKSFNDRSYGKKPANTVEGNRRDSSSRGGNSAGAGKKRIFTRGRKRPVAATPVNH